MFARQSLKVGKRYHHHRGGCRIGKKKKISYHGENKKLFLRGDGTQAAFGK